MPDIHLAHIALSLGLGLFIGLVLALTGAGGSILAIPLLSFCLNLSLNQAAPIALMAVLIASIAGTIQGLRLGIVRYRTAILIAISGVFFAPLGVWTARYLPPRFLSISFLVVLLVVAWSMWRQSAQTSTLENKTSTVCSVNPATSRVFWNAACTKTLMLTGALTGFLSGMLGVGGGFVLIPSLNKVTDFSMQAVIATALFAIALVSIVSIFSYSVHADINSAIAVPFIFGTVSGLFIFRNVGEKVSKKFSQRSFALLAVFAALLMLLKF